VALDSWHETDRSTAPQLSVVVVTYNEAERVSDCLASVFAACQGRWDFEVVLVDSNSTDDTVELAAEYPVAILQIQDDDLTTPGAGRYVGTQVARGDRVLFVDGDMIIEREWLRRALATLSDEPNVAAVDGHLDGGDASGTVRAVDAVRGVALYRRGPLESVGGFHPYLPAVEDIHLGFELTEAGYRLMRLPEVAADHPSRATFTEPLRRWRQGYTGGSGRAVRSSLGSPRLVAKHLHRIRHRLMLLAWLVAGLGALASPWFAFPWLAGSVLATGVLVRKLGVVGAVRTLVFKLLGLVGFVRGLADPIPPRSAFPLDAVAVIQRGRVMTAPPG
jgi:glycosyltransferase involved in cell wall biosynthesis